MIANRARAIGAAAIIASLVGLPAVPPAALADDDGSFVTRDELKALYEAISAQKERLAEQERQLEEQKRRLEAQARELAILKATRQVASDGDGPVQASFTAPKVLPDSLARPAASNDKGKTLAQSQNGEQNQNNGNGQNGQQQVPTQPVGEAPAAEEEAPAVAIASDISVLTKVGQLSVEPQIEYANSSVNRFSFSGLEIVDTILIGLIEATQASRDTYTASLGLRYGLFHRFEIDGRVPYLYRDDRITSQVVGLEGSARDQQLEGDGIGDAEIGAHYQINSGQDGWPFFVGNLKVKSDTGKGPFDVTTDNTGRLSELPTGSGFWAVQPSITVIYPTDPAVMFANVGYIYNIARDIDRTFGENTVGEVDPGDTIVISFGMGIALNDITSISFGYEHDFIGGTEQIVNGLVAKSDDLQVGSLLIGFSHRVLDNVNMNLNLAVGVTDNSPDIKLSLRTPISFQLF